MPEGPEVKLLVETIRPNVVGRKIIRANIVSGKYLTKHKITNWEFLLSKLPLTILELGCHGKFIYFKLDEGISCGIGLGLVGTFKFTHNEKHNRIQLVLDDGQTLYYDDFRNFGNWTVYQSQSELDYKLNHLGVDIMSLGPESQSEIHRIYTQYRDHNICKILMNQEILSGIGVYLKSEALNNQKIYPLANIGDLTFEQFNSLLFAARQIAILSYNYQKNKGIDYRSNKTENSDKRERLFRVYDQKTCPEGFAVVKTETPDNRMTSWIPQTQTIGLTSPLTSIIPTVTNITPATDMTTVFVNPPTVPPTTISKPTVFVNPTVIAPTVPIVRPTVPINSTVLVSKTDLKSEISG